MSHAIVRTDNMSATTDSSMLVSARYYVSTTATAIDNGMLVEIGDYDTNEREVRVVTAPAAATTAIAKLGLVATPELIYDETSHHGLEEFYNEAGKEIRVYRFHNNDVFSVTAEAISGTPSTGKFLVCGTTTQFVVAASEGASATTIGKIVAVETVGSDKYYVCQVTI